VAEDRRRFLEVVTGVLGTSVASVVAAPAIRMLIDPVDRVTVTGSGQFIPVADLAAIPGDGTPISVQVVVEAPRDAWTLLPPTTVGSVFLSKHGDRIRALSTICPHLGCGIDYARDDGRFACPCHESFFSLDGRVASGPAPRAMDELETRVEGGKVLVLLRKFEIGKSEKVPV
jgi:Rieske Fe-S protein